LTINRKLQISLNAVVAQLVELQPSKLNVASSTLVFRSWKNQYEDSKTVKCGSSSVGRASAFQAECREFDPRLPLLEKSIRRFKNRKRRKNIVRVSFRLKFGMKEGSMPLTRIQICATAC